MNVNCELREIVVKFRETSRCVKIKFYVSLYNWKEIKLFLHAWLNCKSSPKSAFLAIKGINIIERGFERINHNFFHFIFFIFMGKHGHCVTWAWTWWFFWSILTKLTRTMRDFCSFFLFFSFHDWFFFKYGCITSLIILLISSSPSLFSSHDFSKDFIVLSILISLPCCSLSSLVFQVLVIWFQVHGNLPRVYIGCVCPLRLFPILKNIHCCAPFSPQVPKKSQKKNKIK